MPKSAEPVTDNPKAMSTTTSSRLSQSPYLSLAATAFATIFIGFGLNAILRPQHALTFFEFPILDPSSSPSAGEKTALIIVNGLMVVYGARDIFMGLAIYAAAYLGSSRPALGGILIAASAVAVVDGVVCRVFAGAEGAEWNHWGYAPALTLVGALLLGIADGR